MTSDLTPPTPDELLLSAVLDGEATPEEERRVTSDPALSERLIAMADLSEQVATVTPLDPSTTDALMANVWSRLDDETDAPEVLSPETRSATVTPIDSRSRPASTHRTSVSSGPGGTGASDTAAGSPSPLADRADAANPDIKKGSSPSGAPSSPGAWRRMAVPGLAAACLLVLVLGALQLSSGDQQELADGDSMAQAGGDESAEQTDDMFADGGGDAEMATDGAVSQEMAEGGMAGDGMVDGEMSEELESRTTEGASAATGTEARGAISPGVEDPATSDGIDAAMSESGVSDQERRSIDRALRAALADRDPGGDADGSDTDDDGEAGAPAPEESGPSEESGPEEMGSVRPSDMDVLGELSNEAANELFERCEITVPRESVDLARASSSRVAAPSIGEVVVISSADVELVVDPDSCSVLGQIDREG